MINNPEKVYSKTDAIAIVQEFREIVLKIPKMSEEEKDRAIKRLNEIRDTAMQMKGQGIK